MPSGWKGVIDGGTIEHIVGGQIGGKSIELLHSGCISPSTQRQTQVASAFPEKTNAKAITKRKRILSFPALTRVRLEPSVLASAHVSVRHFAFHKIEGNDQRLDRVASIAATGRNCLIGRCFKPVGVGLAIRRGVWRHEWFHLTCSCFVPSMVTGVQTPFSGPGPCRLRVKTVMTSSDPLSRRSSHY
jgi:hypothetical protein